MVKQVMLSSSIPMSFSSETITEFRTKLSKALEQDGFRVSWSDQYLELRDDSLVVEYWLVNSTGQHGYGLKNTIEGFAIAFLANKKLTCDGVQARGK